MTITDLTHFTHAELSNFTHKELSMPADELIEKLKSDYRSLPVPTYDKLRIIAESLCNEYENDNDPKLKALAKKLRDLINSPQFRKGAKCTIKLLCAVASLISDIVTIASAFS